MCRILDYRGNLEAKNNKKKISRRAYVNRINSTFKMEFYPCQRGRNSFSKLGNNSGSVTLEMCFIMPIIILIVFMVINLFVDLGGLSVNRRKVYTELYTYDVCDDSKFEHVNVEKGKCIAIFGEGEYSTEFDLCTKRLRRWQAYGNTINKKGD